MMARHRTYFREWRKYRGHTLEVAAELSGMSVGNISAMERGAQSAELHSGWLGSPCECVPLRTGAAL
jgi:hypothetical protein